MSSKLCRIIPIVVGILAILAGILIKETSLRILFFIIFNCYLNKNI